MLELKFFPFNETKEEQLFQFVKEHPWKPYWSLEHIKEFIHLFISSSDFIFDVFMDNTRVAIAVLVDNIQNKGNNACLEVLGVDQKYDVSEIFQILIKHAKLKLLKNRSGIEITIHESEKKIIDFLKSEKFNSYYDIFEMKNDISSSRCHTSMDEISILKKEDFASCYEVTKESFKDNPEMAIPDYEAWRKAKMSVGSLTFVYRENKKIIGFINNVVNDEQQAEIRSVGVLPDYRKKGVGKKLLYHALNEFSQNGIVNCYLTVATKNSSALRLYTALGFQIMDVFKVYCWKRAMEN